MMQQIVGNSPLTKSAIEYAWQQFAIRAGIPIKESAAATFDALGFTLHYAHPKEIEYSAPAIIVAPCDDAAWQNLRTQEPNTLLWIQPEKALPSHVTSQIMDPLPVLFWGAGFEDGRKPFVEKREDGTIVFYADILAATFFMLSRWEEAVATTFDSHDRFSAQDSVAYRQGFLDYPIIDLYGLVLAAWVRSTLPDWEPAPRTFSVQLSHDIDFVRRFQDAKSVFNTLARAIVRRKWREMWTTLYDAYACRYLLEQNSYFQGIYHLADLSSRLGLKSVFNFMATANDPYNTGYDPSIEPIKKCIQRLVEQGHEVGFHAGYHTYIDTVRFEHEKASLDAVAPRQIVGGRQHFLRFRVPATWRCWAEAGLMYDSTLGYAAYEGFRCGTCHPFLVFDLEFDAVLPLKEVPLIVMDGSLRLYRKLTPSEGVEQVMKLAQRCAQVGGTFTLLWHNSSLSGDWIEWAAAYEEMLEQLAHLQRDSLQLQQDSLQQVDVPVS